MKTFKLKLFFSIVICLFTINVFAQHTYGNIPHGNSGFDEKVQIKIDNIRFQNDCGASQKLFFDIFIRADEDYYKNYPNTTFSSSNIIIDFKNLPEKFIDYRDIHPAWAPNFRGAVSEDVMLTIACNVYGHCNAFSLNLGYTGPRLPDYHIDSTWIKVCTIDITFVSVSNFLNGDVSAEVRCFAKWGNSPMGSTWSVTAPSQLMGQHEYLIMAEDGEEIPCPKPGFDIMNNITLGCGGDDVEFIDLQDLIEDDCTTDGRFHTFHTGLPCSASNRITETQNYTTTTTIYARASYSEDYTPCDSIIPFKIIVPVSDPTLAMEFECEGGAITTIVITSPADYFEDDYFYTINGDIANRVSGSAIDDAIANHLATNSSSTFTLSIETECTNEPISETVECPDCPSGNYAIADDITAEDVTICSGQTATLTAEFAGEGCDPATLEFKWYVSQTASTPIPGTSGNSFTTGVLTSDTIFYVSVSCDELCENAINNRKAVSVTINPLATAADITAANVTICSGQTATLTAEFEGEADCDTPPVYKWYVSQTATTPIPGTSGNSFTTGVLTSDTIFYVSVSCDVYCENAINNRKAVSVTVNPLATASDITAANVTICSGQTATLTAEFEGEADCDTPPVYKWYVSQTATTPISGTTGNSFTTGVLTTDTIFYVSVSCDVYCENAINNRKAVSVKVNPLATAADITAANVTICSGQTATLTAEFEGEADCDTPPVYKWYVSQTATTPIPGTSGNSFTTGTLTSDTIFYVSVSCDVYCENAINNRKAVSVTVHPLATAADITAANVTICSGQTATLTAEFEGEADCDTPPVYKWYVSQTATTPIPGTSGNSFTTGTLTSDTIFYVSVSCDVYCENAINNRKAVSVTVHPLATASDITADNVTICSGQTATLTAEFEGEADCDTPPVYKWYVSQTATTPIPGTSGNSFTTGVLTSDTTFYVSVSCDVYCENAINNRKAVSVTINPLATAADITADNVTICSGQTATLTAEFEGEADCDTPPVYKWYVSQTATTPIPGTTGNTFTTGVLTSDTIFYVSVSCDVYCENAINNRKAVSVTVNPLATAADITAANVTICSGQTATLTAEFEGEADCDTPPVYKWYVSQTATTPIPGTTGNTFTTGALTSDTTFYVSVSCDVYCENAINNRKAVSVTVNPLATASDITADNVTICSGQTATLTAEFEGEADCDTPPVYKWYVSQTATTPIPGTTGNTFTTGVLTSDTIFYVSVSCDVYCENAINNRKAVSVTVHPLTTAADITAANVTICSGQTATLTAEFEGEADCDTPPVYKWYVSQTATTPIPGTTGNTFTTGVLMSDTIFYVSVSCDVYCENTTGNRKAVSVKVNPRAVAADITASNPTICYGDSVRLTASSNIGHPKFYWYDGLTAAATQVGEGSSFTTPTLTTTTTYYVAVEGDGYCENAPANRKPVTVTVNPLATAANITVANDTICSGTTSTLTASSNIGHPKFYWYNGPTATAVLVSNANPFTTLTLTTTTTYYVAVSGDGYCENAPANRKPVTVTVNPRATAADIIIADAIVCEGESATLTPTTNISDPTFYWYINQTTTTYFHTGNHYDTPNLYADVTYYIAVAGENYCENTINTRKPVRVTVKRTSTVPTITNDQPKCLGEEITFRVTNASSYSNGVTFTWYKANPTTQVGTGVTYATTVPGEYFVIASDAGCFSPASTPMEAFFGEAASITWEVEPVINVSGTTAVITGTITNTGIADMLPPIHVTFYKNNIAPSAIMGMDVIDYALEIGESYPLTFTITNWSDFTPIAGIWVSINDNMGVYPEQMECSADGRRYIERKCPDTIEYYGIKYSVTPLGGYCWTSNLQTTLYDDGSQIAFANPYNHPQYPNVEENQAIFGLLYTWFSAVGVPEGYTDGLSGVIQGICPYGWHVPSQAELDVLSLFPASDLKSKDYWLVPGNDTYGFDARPAGRYNSITGRYEDLYGYTGWWASNTNPGVFANYVSMSYFCNSPENKLIKRADGLSVRCIMD